MPKSFFWIASHKWFTSVIVDTANSDDALKAASEYMGVDVKTVKIKPASEGMVALHKSLGGRIFTS